MNFWKPCLLSVSLSKHACKCACVCVLQTVVSHLAQLLEVELQSSRLLLPCVPADGSYFVFVLWVYHIYKPSLQHNCHSLSNMLPSRQLILQQDKSSLLAQAHGTQQTLGAFHLEAAWQTQSGTSSQLFCNCLAEDSP